jgi:hypothetical protein
MDLVPKRPFSGARLLGATAHIYGDRLFDHAGSPIKDVDSGSFPRCMKILLCIFVMYLNF